MENSLQELFYNTFIQLQENEKLLAEQFTKFVETFPKLPIEETYTLKDKDSNNLLKETNEK